MVFDVWNEIFRNDTIGLICAQNDGLGHLGTDPVRY